MDIEGMTQRLALAQPAIKAREDRYRGVSSLRYAATDDIPKELKGFGVNLCRLAVDAVAERMRIKGVTATVRGQDVSEHANLLYESTQLPQLLNPLLVDALALGSAYLIVWPNSSGVPTITPESARTMITSHDPVTGSVTGALKRWQERDHSGVVVRDHVITYERDGITHYVGSGGTEVRKVETRANPLGEVPVIPLINVARIGERSGGSVIDDMGHLVDALNKILTDMLVASEDVARPRRWASGVELEDDYDDDGFTADGVDDDPAAPALGYDDDPLEGQAVSPFEDGNRMWTVESADAKFGQLPGADLAGYRTAVDLLVQQIMSVSALPAHMLGITTSNPSSADAIRAAEASLTARAESRISVLGLALERALALMVAMEYRVNPSEVTVNIKWASAGTRSVAQEADAVTKLHALGILSTDEAREIMGVDSL